MLDIASVPNDAKLAEEIARVQKAKDSAVSSQAVANPSKECLDICAKSKPSRSNDKECVVTCITTMRKFICERTKTPRKEVYIYFRYY